MTNRRKKSARLPSDAERWRNLCEALADDALAEKGHADQAKVSDFLAGLHVGAAIGILGNEASRQGRPVTSDETPQGKDPQGNKPRAPDDLSPEPPKH
jgi:hypothetical protein